MNCSNNDCLKKEFKDHADLILYNANILTMDIQSASWICFEEDKIVISNAQELISE